MKTQLDLPRPLLLQAASLAARRKISLSRFVAETLAQLIRADPPIEIEPPPDLLFDEFRDELGL
ncbi:hypothetical protein HNR46_002043 [Haloferula luteola]|uniref:Uncharacterized protein n=1 Tax=Haloferula luteola TaxID=595692 RepID=A0A840V888_9BACT|nr:hypothetical protein [Haloferula luteola]MBB5351804.1 hypothetical protein [Haloferula luteola]